MLAEDVVGWEAWSTSSHFKFWHENFSSRVGSGPVRVAVAIQDLWTMEIQVTSQDCFQ